MTDTLTAPPTFARINSYEDAPAVFSDGWLPDIGAFPDLVEARSEFLRLKAAWAGAGQRRTLIQNKRENDQQRRELALRDAYLRGESAKLEAEDPKLAQEAIEVQQEAQAAVSAFIEHINRCIALVLERGTAWFASIDEYQMQIDQQVAELMEQVAKLRTKRGNFRKFEHWTERTGVHIRPPSQENTHLLFNVSGALEPHAHFPYSEIATPQSAGDESALQESLLKAYAGGDWSQRPYDEGDTSRAALLDRRNAEAVMQPPEQDVELNDLDEDDLTDWLMSCGAFDGKPKPGPDLVVAAAEGDPVMAQRLVKAERRANESGPRKAVVDQLEQIVGAR